MLTDTSPEAESLHLRLLRQRSDEDRLSQTLVMTQMVRDLAKQAIAQSHPNLTPQEQALKFVQIHYGESVAEQLSERLNDDPQ